MVQTSSALPHQTHHSILALAVLFLFIVLFKFTAGADSAISGLTVDLIHPYSKYSPYHNPNLTKSQIFKRLYGQSRYQVTALRPELREKDGNYLVKVKIGTGYGQRTSYLQLDTGSSVTWTACKPCNPCNIRQQSPMFDPDHSPTYAPLPHNHPLCNGLNCRFGAQYEDGSSAFGSLGQDTFTFRADSGNDGIPLPLVFGCASTIDLVGDKDIDGILGMGWERVSFPMQLQARFGGHFSYCLTKPGSGSVGYLRFGPETHSWVPPAGTTPIRRYGVSNYYYLDLNDISVGGSRLHFDHGIFERHGDRGGCIIDTGTQASRLINPAYGEVRLALVRHFRSRGFHPITGQHGFDLCYRTMDNYQSLLPGMTLHFEGADYHLGWDKVFILDHQNGLFCWIILPWERATVLGAYQQFNTRISFNTEDLQLSFAPENCAHR